MEGDVNTVISTLQLRQMDLRIPSNVCETDQLGSGRAGMWITASLILKPMTMSLTPTVQTEGHDGRCRVDTNSQAAVLPRTHLPKVVWINCGR